MKPFKAGQPAAAWLIRLATVASILAINGPLLYPVRLGQSSYYTSAGLVFFSLLALAGGLFSKIKLTIISGLTLSLISIYLIICNFSGVLSTALYIYIFWLAGGFYLLCFGNK